MAARGKSSTRRTSTTRTGLLMVLALLIALPLGVLPAPAAAEESIGCGCETTGDYKNIAKLVSASVDDKGMSPDETYQVSASGTPPGLTLTVKRVADGSTVLSLDTSAVDWGFSPDENRFLTVRNEGGTTAFQLYDLTAADPEEPVLNPEPSFATTNSRLGFSPNGDYLVFARLVNATTVNFGFWDTTTGAYQETGNFQTIQGSPAQGKGGSTYNGVTFGFGPTDDAFVYAYVDSLNQTHLTLLNLDNGTRPVDNRLVAGGFWQLSPCGDVIGIVSETSNEMLNIELVSVSTGEKLNNEQSAFQFGEVEFKTTDEWHVMTLTTTSGSTDYQLAPNTAAESCEEPPDEGDTTAPTWPDNANILPGTITETSIELTWTAAQDDTAVTGYTLSVYRVDDSGGTDEEDSSGSGCLSCAEQGTSSSLSSADSLILVDTLETTGLSAVVTDLKSGTTYKFNVEAHDEAGNKSDDGPSITVATLAVPAGLITGQVWFDPDGDQQRDSNESPIVFPQLVAWKLIETDVEGQFTIGGWPHDQLLSDGRYFFRDLDAGTYLVMLKGNRVQSFPGGLAPHVVTLDESQGVRGVDFFVTGDEVPETGSASISGVVFDDLNGNSVRNAGEPGIAGVTVCASHSNWYAGDCVESDTDGSYLFENLPPGLYQVSGDWVDNRYATLPPDESAYIFTLSGGEPATLDLGYAPGSGGIQGTIWNDLDGNGGRDSGEAGLADIEVCYWGPDKSDCRLTAEDGSYEFTGLVPGEYAVWFNTDGGLIQTYPDDEEWEFELDPDQTMTDIDFGVSLPAPAAPAEIRGVVWGDLNLNEQRDEGETGVAGVEVCYHEGVILLGVSASEASTEECTHTDDTGAYVFTGVRPGSYTVEVSAETTYPQFGYNEVHLEGGDVGTADFGIKLAGLPPQIEPIADQTSREGDEVALQVNATDPEGGQLWYDAQRLPDGLSIDLNSGLISGTIAPGSADASPYRVRIYVADEMANVSEFRFTWTVDAASNTPAGSNVTVSPLGGDGMTITFESVTAAGETSVVTGDSGPETPTGFMLGEPPVFYEISTTATFAGSATVCLTYDETTFGDEFALALFHFEDGAWLDVTTSHDPGSNTICGAVESFSPFVVLEMIPSPPTLTLPEPITVNATSPAGAAVSFDARAADSTGAALPVNCSASTGDIFPIGVTTVTCSAGDEGQQVEGSFTVTVLGAKQQIVALLRDVGATNMPFVPKLSLSVLLGVAAMGADLPTPAPSCAALASAAKVVDRYEPRQISSSDAAWITADIHRIRNVLGC